MILKRPYLIFFLHIGICLPFIMLLWNHGHHPTDDGYMLAYSWRIWNGQIPYADFLFDKPPLTPILHTIWFFLGESNAFNAARIGYYFQMSVISTCWSIWAISRGWLYPSLPSLSVLAIFTLLSLHTFPPTSWYTVDSVMLSSLGILLFLFSFTPCRARNFLLLRIGSGLLVGASALCKQNFFAIQAAWILFCTIDCLLARHRDPSKLQGSLFWCASFITVSFLPMISIMLWISSAGASAEGFRNTGQLVTTSALLAAGWYDYIHNLPQTVPYFALGIFLAAAKPWRERIDWVPLALIVTVFYLLFGNMSNVTHGILGGTPIFFMALGMLLGRLGRFTYQREYIAWEDIVFCFFAFAIPWSASISLGWRTPLLGIASLSPFFAASVSTTPNSRTSFLTNLLAVVSTVALTIVFVQFHTHYAYRDVPRSSQNYNLASVFPRFGSLYVSQQVHSQYSQLKEISSQVRASDNSEMIILGEHPLFSFLDNRLNPTSLDWYYPAHYIGAENRILNELRQNRPIVVIPVQDNNEKCLPSLLAEPMTSWVQESGSLFHRTLNFCAYRLHYQ